MDGDGYYPKVIKWCEDKDRVLREMWPSHTGREIAATMARKWPEYSWSRNVIIGRANRLHLECKRLAPDPTRPRPERRTPSPPPVMCKDPASPRLDLRSPEIPEPPLPRARQRPGEIIEPMIGQSTILGVGTAQCRFPMWADNESGAPDFPLCGRKKKPGSSYCEAHHAVCWRPPPRKAQHKLFIIGDSKSSLISKFNAARAE